MANLTIVFSNQPVRASTHPVGPPFSMLLFTPILTNSNPVQKHSQNAEWPFPPPAPSTPFSLPALLFFQMMKWHRWVRKGHGYPQLCEWRDRAKNGGGWEDLGMFMFFLFFFCKDGFMPQLINDYASQFLHALICRDDGCGADILSPLAAACGASLSLSSHRLSP